MNDLTELVKALRCEGVTKRCDSCGYGYHLSPLSECNDVCHVEQILTDAAAAIEELQAEVKQAAKRNAELHAELEKWVSAAEKAAQPHWVSVKERLP